MTDTQKTSRHIPQKIETAVWGKGTDDTGKKITLCHGYDFYNDILGKYTVAEIFFLLIKGELPTPTESSAMNLLITTIINPGPTDWSTVAAMTASVSNTTVGNSLIAGVSALQSRYNGGLLVEKSMEMFQAAQKQYQNDLSVSEIVTQMKKNYPDLPGYGLDRNVRDEKALKLIKLMEDENINHTCLYKAIEMEACINEEKGIWLTLPGVVSAVLTDLGFDPLDGHGIFIVASLPGILAHVLGQMKKGKWNAFPFYDPPEYSPEQIKSLSENQKAYGGNHG